MAVFQVLQTNTYPQGKTCIGIIGQELEDQFTATINATGKIINRVITISSNAEGLTIENIQTNFATEEDYLEFISLLHENPIVLERNGKLLSEGVTIKREPQGYIDE